MPSKFAFKLIFNTDLKAGKGLSVQRNPAVLWLMKTCTFPMEITKPGAQSLRIKMRNAKLNLTGATVIYGLQPLAARPPELA